MKLFLFVALALLCPIFARASITSTVDKSGPFVFTGSPQVIPTGINFQQGSDLLVLDIGAASVTHDPALVLALGSDFTVTGGGYNSANQMQTGSIRVVSTGTNSVQVGDNIVILRGVPLNQISSFTATGPLTISLLEQALDKMATLSQQVNEATSRSLHFENFEFANGNLSLAARKNNVIGFDANGNLSFSPGGGGGGTTYTAGTGLLLAANQFSVNPVQSLTSLTVTNPIAGDITGNAATATLATNATSATTAGIATTITNAASTANSTFYPFLSSSPTGGNQAVFKAANLTYNPSTGALVAPSFTGNLSSSSVAITGGTINGASVTGLPTPSSGTDAATKTYVDNNSTGIVQRTGVIVATTANLTLSGEQTIDGVLTSTSRILVKNQSASAQNGIYVTAAGAWSRAADSNTAAQLKVGYYYFVSSGTTQGATGWTIQTAPTTLGTDPVLFGQFSASTSYTAGTGLNLAGNVFSNTGVVSLAGTTGEVAFSAASGSVTGSLPSALNFSGKTVTGGTYSSGAFNGTVGATTPATGTFTSLSATGAVNLSSSSDFNPQLIETNVSSTPSSSAYLVHQRARAATTAVQSGDTLSQYLIQGYANSAYQNAALLTATASGAPSGSNIPTTVTWTLNNGSGNVVPFTLTGTGLNSTAVGATTPSTGVFTTTRSATATVTGNAPTNADVYLLNSGGAADEKYSSVRMNSSTLGFHLHNDLQTLENPAYVIFRTGYQPNLQRFYIGAGVGVADITSTGINNAAIGATTPSTGAFTTLTGSSTATGTTTSRTLANRFAAVYNVKDFGAVGDGTTDDTGAINGAILALVNHGTLFFPTGKYRMASGATTFNSLSYITITGQGAEIYMDNTNANTFVFSNTCSDFEVCNLRFTSSATARASGIILRSYCSNVKIHDCSFSNSSDFAVHISNDNATPTYSTNIIVAHNIFTNTCGDGVHVGSASSVNIIGNVFFQTGDDSIGIVRDALSGAGSLTPTRINVIGNTINRSGYGPSAVSGCGMRIEEANDVLVEGNLVDFTYQAPIRVGRFTSTTAYNSRIKITGNKVLNGNQLNGEIGSINLQFCNGVTVSDNNIDSPANGGGVGVLDCNDLVIDNNVMNNIPNRGVYFDDGTTTNVAASSTRSVITNNKFLLTTANQAIYVVPATGKTVNDLFIAGNIADNVPAGDYIFYNRVTTGRIFNNLRSGSQTISAGGSVSGVTLGNNN